jgi:hypothetical protein
VGRLRVEGLRVRASGETNSAHRGHRGRNQELSHFSLLIVSCDQPLRDCRGFTL